MNTDVRAWSGGGEVVADDVVADVEAQSNWWRSTARWALYGAAFLTPLLFLPLTIPPTLVKQVAVSSLTFIAFIAWLGEMLLSGRVSYKRSLVNPAFLLLLVALFLSTLFSSQAFRGILSSDNAGEEFISFLVFSLVYFIAGSILRGRDESNRLIGWVIAGGFLLSLFSLVQFFAPPWVPFSSLARADVNTVGTTNALAVLLGFYFVMALGIFTHTSADLGKWVRILLGIFLVSLFLNLIIINFRSVWIAIAVALMVLLGFKIGFSHWGHARGRVGLREGSFSLLFLVLAVCTFLILSRVSLITIPSIPAEISPSYQATVDIARKTLTDSLWLGSGPGTFGMDYSLYRDPSINQTNFWGVRFNSGAAFLPTALATTGVLGVLFLLLLSLTAVFSFLRQVAREGTHDAILLGGTAAVVFGFLLWWLYTGTFAFQAVLFLVLGAMAARVNEKAPGDGTPSVSRVSNRTFTFSTPWATFAASLGVIFLMVAGISLLYYNIQHYISAVAFTRGVESFSRGDVDNAVANIVRAASLNTNNDQYYRALAEVMLARVQNVLNRAATSQDPNLRNEFQANVSDAISAAQRATVVNPNDSLNWVTLGLVYQALVPFLQGAEGLAIQAYDKALQYEPQNPSYQYSKAGTHVALADRVQTLMNQGGQSEEAQAALETQYTDALVKARESLEKSLGLKSDYAQANYLLAQVLLREGDVARAIGQVEAVKQLAPLDIGVAFQLGVLYYQSNELAKAQAEFSRAVAMNENYSNARYFLGLIYDRRGEKEKAITEFERIQTLNPDNQEVKTILTNLRVGKAALQGISPPAPAPDRRSEPPVKDEGQPEGQLP
ncbi:MAG: tetratricopeptide repeat protein [Candidatus Sungbacteria bacterium]|nr:tetratricopeptide repeat protein [Candidatus Sungbacteria bacterium]